MHEIYTDRRCPQCRRLLFKETKMTTSTPDHLKCGYCKNNFQCQNCSETYCSSMNGGNPVKCPSCTQENDCSDCDRFYYRAWKIEKNRAVQIKCPKCKKIIKINAKVHI